MIEFWSDFQRARVVGFAVQHLPGQRPVYVARLGAALHRSAYSLSQAIGVPRRGLLATRIVCAGEEREWVPEFVRRVYTANFAEDLDIAEASVLLNCLSGLVEDPAAVVSAARGQTAKVRVRRNTERAIALGTFGAPSFVVGEELF